MSQIMTTDIVHWLLAAVGVGGGCTAVAYFAFKFLATKWLENKFAERLEAYKHEQQKELEQLKFQINASFDRLTKLHQHEFQVLPDAWALLINAFVEARAFISSLQSYPDLTSMKPAQFAEFVEACPLATWQKEELKSVPQEDKNDYYQDKIFWHSCKSAGNLSDECHTFLRKNGIFIEKEIKEQFQTVDQLIREAIVMRQSIRRYGVQDWEKIEAFSKQGDALLDKLENAVQGRLWTHDSKS